MRLNTRRGVRVFNRGSGSYTLIERLFRNGAQGAHYEAYDPGVVVRRRNRFLSSSDFTAVWNATAVLSRTRRADGLGDLIVPTTVNTSHTLTQTVAVVGDQNAVVVRAKAGGYDWLAIQVAANAAYYDLGTGALGSKSAGVTSSITAVDGMPGYYDCLFADVPSTNLVTLYVASANNTVVFAGDGTSGIYLARGQIDWHTLTPSAYQDITDWTTEYKAEVARQQYKVRLWQDTARKIPVTDYEQPVACWDDWSGWSHHLFQGTAPSRALLSCRYNYAVKTEDLTDAAVWIAAGTPTITRGAFTAPVSSRTACSVTATLAAQTRLRQVITTSAFTTEWKARFYIRAGTVATGSLTFRNSTAGTFIVTSAQIISGPGAVVVAAGIANISGLTSSWTLVEITTTTMTAAQILEVYFFVKDSVAAAIGDSLGGWGLDVRPAQDWNLSLPAYQRVNTATDYDTTDFLPFIKPDGVDDYMLTSHDVDCRAYDCGVIVVSAMKLDVTSAFWTGIGALGVQNATAGSFDMFTSGTSAINLRVHGGSSGADRVWNNPSAPAGTLAVFAGKFDVRSELGIANNLRLFQDLVEGSLTLQDTLPYPQKFINSPITLGHVNTTTGSRFYGITIVADSAPLDSATFSELLTHHAALQGRTL